MPKFVLIEQSLSKVGGHYYEYSLEILNAAQQAGYTPYLGLNQAFPDPTRFPSSWKVFPVFPYTSDRIHRVPRAYNGDILRNALRGQRNWRDTWFSLTEGLGDSIKSVVSPLRRNRHQSRISGFANACRELFAAIQLEEDDQVLCSTMADGDLLGLVEYLASDISSRKADWHLQFHFNIYAGREPDYERQENKALQLKRRLDRSLAKLTDHRTHFYTTTDLLGDQFRRLGSAEFQTLPWPVGERFHAGPPHRAQEAGPVAPLRLALAGAVRREKGGDFVRQLVDELWDDYLATGRLQLVLQSNSKQRSQSMLDLPEEMVVKMDDVRPHEYPDSPIIMVPHPLDDQQYATFIKSADIGLLLYHADEYYVRCSGILVEMLSAGVPVIVPGGCWLSQQLAATHDAYLRGLVELPDVDRLWSRNLLARQRRCVIDEGGANIAAAGDVLAVGPQPVVFDFDLIPHTSLSDLLLSMEWLDRRSGDYLQIRLKQFDADGKLREQTENLIEPGPESAEGTLLPGGSHANGPSTSAQQEVASLFRIGSETTRCRLEIRSPFGDRIARINRLEAALLSSQLRATHLPASRVGLSFSSPNEIPRLVKEMVDQISHYRDSAFEHSQMWNKIHSPANSIEIIRRAAERKPAGNRESAA